MYTRLCNPLISNSFFLFGARGTGKTSLLKELFLNKSTFWIDLLNENEYLKYLKEPGLLHQQLLSLKPNPPEWVVIDEVQKLPFLLDEVQRKIEDDSFHPRLKFALTGSSARKLKRGSANLLAGRAFMNKLHPLTDSELGEFDLNEILHWGTLPKIFQLDLEEKKEFLRAYSNTYLKEEIKEEQIVRKIDPFVRFLEVAAQSNGKIINFSNIARDSFSDPKAIERYFQILEDTLIGFFLDPFHPSLRKRQVKKPKFYFFDLGIKRALEGALNTSILPRTYAFGDAFEHLIILECHRLNDYLRKDFRFSYYRSQTLEVDLVIERPGEKILLVEIKSSSLVDDVEINKLEVVSNAFPDCEALILSMETQARKSGKIEILPWKKGLQRIFNYEAKNT